MTTYDLSTVAPYVRRDLARGELLSVTQEWSVRNARGRLLTWLLGDRPERYSFFAVTVYHAEHYYVGRGDDVFEAVTRANEMTVGRIEDARDVALIRTVL